MSERIPSTCSIFRRFSSACSRLLQSLVVSSVRFQSSMMCTPGMSKIGSRSNAITVPHRRSGFGRCMDVISPGCNRSVDACGDLFVVVFTRAFTCLTRTCDHAPGAAPMSITTWPGWMNLYLSFISMSLKALRARKFSRTDRRTYGSETCLVIHALESWHALVEKDRIDARDEGDGNSSSLVVLVLVPSFFPCNTQAEGSESAFTAIGQLFSNGVFKVTTSHSLLSDTGFLLSRICLARVSRSDHRYL